MMNTKDPKERLDAPVATSRFIPLIATVVPFLYCPENVRVTFVPETETMSISIQSTWLVRPVVDIPVPDAEKLPYFTRCPAETPTLESAATRGAKRAVRIAKARTLTISFFEFVKVFPSKSSDYWREPFDSFGIRDFL